MNNLNKRLHWTTTITEKVMLGGIGFLTVLAAGCEVWDMWIDQNIELADLFLLFIYTEIVGMVGAYYISNRIPVTLPIIIAMKRDKLLDSSTKTLKLLKKLLKRILMST